MHSIYGFNLYVCFRIPFLIGLKQEHTTTIFSYFSLATLSNTLMSEDKAFHPEYLSQGRS